MRLAAQLWCMSPCPNCNRPIPFRTVLFAAYPVWLSCPGCGAKLVGDRFIKIQGFVIVPLMLSSSALLVVLTHRPFLYRLALVPIAALIIAFPNVMATLMWGRYLLRRKRAGMRSNLMVVGAASVILLFSGYDYVPKSTRAPSERVCRSFLKQIDMA